MPWVRIDDQFAIHRKVETLSDPAFRLHVSALCWCNRNLTDGAIPKEELEVVAPRTMKRPEKFAAELVERGLWIETPPLGWVINDYLEFQESKDQIEERKRKTAERQARWREARRNGVTNGGQ